MAYWPPYQWYFDPLSMESWPPYPWYFDPPIHGILTPYPYHIDPPTHGISTALPMVFWLPYLWYIKPPTHGMSNLLPMVYQTSYPWYFNPLPMVFWPPIHGILTPFPTHDILNPYPWYIDPLPMVFWFRYLWDIEPPTHGISNPLSISWLEMRGGVKIPWWFNLPYRGGGSGQYTMDENWPQGQNTIWHQLSLSKCSTIIIAIRS
jgi:hypothetical protein